MSNLANLYDRKFNLPNKPTLTNRSIEVILKTQEFFPGRTLGDCIELLMQNENLYWEIIDELKETYPTIVPLRVDEDYLRCELEKEVK